MNVLQTQWALLALGYDLPKYGADGDLGKETKTALKSFAADMRLGHAVADDVADLAQLLSKLRNVGTRNPREFVHGIDVSGWQPSDKFDWPEVVEDGVKFIYVKATEGRTPRKSFASHWKAAHDVGLLRGAYHVGYFKRNGKRQHFEQAEAFVRAIEAEGLGLGELPPAADVEWMHFQTKEKRHADMGVRYKAFPAEAVVEWTIRFVERVKQLTGRTCVLYTGKSFWKHRMHKTEELAPLKLWQAAYTGDGHETPDEWPTSMTPPWDKVTIHQYAGGRGRLQDGDGDGHVGFVKPIDRNLFNGSLEQLKALG